MARANAQNARRLPPPPPPESQVRDWVPELVWLLIPILVCVGVVAAIMISAHRIDNWPDSFGPEFFLQDATLVKPNATTINIAIAILNPYKKVHITLDRFVLFALSGEKQITAPTHLPDTVVGPRNATIWSVVLNSDSVVPPVVSFNITGKGFMTSKIAFSDSDIVDSCHFHSRINSHATYQFSKSCYDIAA